MSKKKTTADLLKVFEERAKEIYGDQKPVKGPTIDLTGTSFREAMEDPKRRLPPFLMVQNPDNPTAQYILSTSPPYYMGHVWKFADEVQHENWQTSYLVDYSCQVGDYRIYITESGSLAPPLFAPAFARVEEQLKQMADFFLSFKIQGQEAKYRRYKEL